MPHKVATKSYSKQSFKSITVSNKKLATGNQAALNFILSLEVSRIYSRWTEKPSTLQGVEIAFSNTTMGKKEKENPPKHNKKTFVL